MGPMVMVMRNVISEVWKSLAGGLEGLAGDVWLSELMVVGFPAPRRAAGDCFLTWLVRAS